ncbi:MAG: CotH kinase family protein [Candidatus Hinthialibacter antarcticus]|nr:CotH kinase family protein [Candidatus Hinthialibacter antarcticus]
MNFIQRNAAIACFMFFLSITSSQSQVVINEIHYNPPDIGTEDGLFREFIELYNAGSESVDLTGYAFDDGITYTFPDNASIFPGQYIVLAKNLNHSVWRNSSFRIFGPYEGRLDNGGERVTLRNAQGIIVETIRYNDAPPWPRGADGYDASLERVDPTTPTDDSHSWRASTNPGGTPGAVNSVHGTPPYPTLTESTFTPSNPTSSDAVQMQVTLDAPALIESVFLNIDDGANEITGTTVFESASPWRFWKGTTAPSDASEWTTLAFRDSNWQSAQGGFGYGDLDRVNTTLNDMRSNYSTLYLRKAFSLPTLSARQAFFLDIYYDDAFICYINGVEVARENAPDTYTNNSLAAGGHESNSLSTFALPHSVFTQGENVIALVGFNISLGGSSDFVLAPSLRYQDNNSSRIEMTKTAQTNASAIYQATLPPAPSQTIVRTNLTIQLTDGGDVTLPHSAEPTPFLSYFVYDNEIESTLPLLWTMQPKSSPLLTNGRTYGAAVALPIGAAHPTLFDGALIIPSESGREKIRFIKGAEFFGDRTINVIPEVPTGGTNAGISSPYREHLGYWFFSQMGVLSPWGEFYRTIELPFSTQNTQRQQLVFQQINERFLEMHGLDSNADLYKLERRANPNWEKHTNLAEGNASINELLNALNSSRRETIETRFNLDNMLAFSAASIFTSNWDGYWQNYWTYLDPATNRWEMYPWDLDWIWGATPPPNTGPMYAEMPLSFPIDGNAIGDRNVSRPAGPVTSPMHQDPQYYEAYIQRLSDEFNHTFGQAFLFAKIDADQQQLLADLALLNQQTGRNVGQRIQQIQSSYETLKEYIIRRRAYLQPRLPQSVNDWAVYE